jgi:hypothetical protein
MDQSSHQAVAAAITSIEAAERRVAEAILRTPTGGERNALCDVNIHLGAARQGLHVLSQNRPSGLQLSR